MVGVEGDAGDPPAGGKHARGFRKRRGPVDEMDREPVDDAVEPAVLERERLRPPLAHPDARRQLPARDLEHARLGVDAQTRASARSARGAASRPVPRTDVEHALRSQIGLFDQRVEIAHQPSSTGRSRS